MNREQGSATGRVTRPRNFRPGVSKPGFFRPGEKFNFEPGTRPGFEIQPGNRPGQPITYIIYNIKSFIVRVQVENRLRVEISEN